FLSPGPRFPSPGPCFPSPGPRFLSPELTWSLFPHLQLTWRRRPRHSSHFPLCSFCCNCCKNRGCGFCCRT
ncbi:HEPC2 protein, partial [Leiothrix lutea]|nr:HEPC2 protein [Leiothrix lutea]